MAIPPLSAPPTATTSGAQLADNSRGAAELIRQVAPLANRVSLPAGTIIAAHIIAQAPVTVGEKQQLMQQLNTLNDSQDDTTSKALKQLMASTELTLVTLKLPSNSNKGNGNLFTTLSAQAFATGGPVKLMVRADGQLQLLSTATALPAKSSPVTTTSAATREFEPSRSGLSVLASAPQKSILEAHLSQLLRTSLPKAQTSAALLQFFHKISAQISPAHLPQIITGAGVKLLDVLHEQSQKLIQVAAQPQHTAPLKAAILSSGVLLEANIKAQLGATSIADAATDKMPRPAIMQDNKAVLLAALHSLNQPAPAPNPPEVKTTGAVDLLLARLFGQSAAEPAKTPEKMPHLQQQSVDPKFLLREALIPLLQKSLARIQLQQSQTASALLHEPNLTHLQLDIPLRLPDGYGNLALQIQELPYYATDENPAETATPGTEKIRQWRVFMEFDLQDAGFLAAQIHWLPQQLRAQFWANNAVLRKKTQTQLAELEVQLKEAGLPLESLICNADDPPKSTLNLQYALVDVRT